MPEPYKQFTETLDTISDQKSFTKIQMATALRADPKMFARLFNISAEVVLAAADELHPQRDEPASLA